MRDRAADREAVVVLVIRRRLVVDIRRNIRRAIEETHGVKEAVAVDLKQIAVVAVGARLHLVRQRALAQAELRREGGALDLVLLPPGRRAD